jgi:hypothetical protein
MVVVLRAAVIFLLNVRKAVLAVVVEVVAAVRRAHKNKRRLLGLISLMTIFLFKSYKN